MRPRELHRVAPVARARGQLREAARLILARPELRVTLSLAVVVAAFGRNYQVTMAAMVIGPLHAGAGAYGVCSTAFAVGGVLGACATALLGPPRPRALVGVAAGAAALQVLAGIAPTLGTFAAVLVPVAVGAVIVDTLVVASVQLATPGEARGRAASVVALAGMGGSAAGALALGALADRWGGRAALVLGGGAVLGATLVVSVVRARQRTSARTALPVLANAAARDERARRSLVPTAWVPRQRRRSMTREKSSIARSKTTKYERRSSSRRWRNASAMVDGEPASKYGEVSASSTA
jgi:MFS family permease